MSLDLNLLGAISRLIDEFWDTNYGRATEEPNTYTTRRMGNFNVVLLCLSNVGKSSAAGATAYLRMSYSKLKLVLLTGICGGVPRSGESEEILLGDVVIDSLDDNLGRPTKNARNFVTPFKIDMERENLEDQAASQHVYDECNGASVAVCEEPRRVSCKDLGCDENELLQRERLKEKRILESRGEIKEAQGPCVFVGRFGSGDTVLKSGEYRNVIAKRHDLMAFEMEGLGV
ncbi:hypothetical protein EDB81DRAFT_838441 [Dactylonectria macrodidyma]|uniref:Nucleoside phosphorylase domain-containing protein n=1 Tax=Dactylonectria macrodidyma TaxID=307937 RepID=A0A9P9JFY5_9HYPO|nr:hypothetical protein EDB81DRAFT_838441 [Dactylonectria macrodidyma]